MSTIPKEIQKEADKRFPSKGRFDLLRNQGFVNGAIFGYQLATDGQEELEKECEGKEKEIAELRYELNNKVGNYEILESESEQRISELEARAIKSLEESEKQFGELQEAYNKLIGS